MVREPREQPLTMRSVAELRAQQVERVAVARAQSSGVSAQAAAQRARAFRVARVAVELARGLQEREGLTAERVVTGLAGQRRAARATLAVLRVV